MTELSPAAQAVILEYSKIAYDSEIELLFSPLPWEHRAVAAALRAVATQEEILFDAYDEPISSFAVRIDDLLSIADELENQ